MNPFGNRDEPSPPYWYMAGSPQWLRFVAWYVRNPFHNLTHYVWGWTGQPFSIVKRTAADNDNDGFADNKGWMVVILGLKSARRMYVSHGKPQTYVGWHPASGKLGTRGWIAWLLLIGLLSSLISPFL